ncbi:hypothetical protein OAY_10175 [Vibrio cyclitrophicus ZF205]|uniref:DUF726 domain-containing protein n=1 Tax=Vibrio cyclitrophicus TaxID=47951 RepID=UPI00030BE6E7|nr:DUF726 domain-containing protein [Vibrio cyclitrophicus]OEE18285.1 hypothetical protein OAY_10175 [Vibrio cyclitrophicus ZF205]
MSTDFLPSKEENFCSITTVREGIEPVICVINGFMSESGNDVTDWLSIVDILYPNNKVVHFDWPAGNLRNMLFSDTGSNGGDDNGLAMKAGSIINLFRANPAISAASVVANQMTGRWQVSLKNAEKAGQFLASHINQSQESFVLMGHSLGARIVYYTLTDLYRFGAIESALLFGGAITNTGEWQKILHRHPNLWICNCYSHNDIVLKFLYKAGTLFTNRPIGLDRISANHQHLYNFNTSEYVSGHTAYKNKTVGNFLAWKFLEIQERQALAQQFVTSNEELNKIQGKAFKNNQKFENQLDELNSEQQRSIDAINKI